MKSCTDHVTMYTSKVVSLNVESACGQSMSSVSKRCSTAKKLLSTLTKKALSQLLIY
jgi:hypothetical protein